MARIMALDCGTKRTGVAVTDELQIIASGLTTVKTKDLLSFLNNYMKTGQVECLVIGKPKQMDNSESESEPLVQVHCQPINSFGLLTNQGGISKSLV